jgi:hypothetical protein
MEKSALLTKLNDIKELRPKINCKTCIFSPYPDGGSCTTCHQFCNWVHNKPASEYLCELCDFCDLENNKCKRSPDLLNCSDEFHVLWKEISKKNIDIIYQDKSCINLEQLFKTYANCHTSYDASEMALDEDAFKVFCLKFAEQLLNLAAENAYIDNHNKVGCCIEPDDFFVNKQSIVDIIKLIT